MDKKQKKKLIPAVCFVLICGVVYLGIHYGGQRKEQIVLEKVSQGDEQKGTTEDNSDIGIGSDLYETVGSEAEVTGALKEESLLYVHVCGAVITEGVYTLPEGSRVSDGITAAGGFSEQADTAYHNLAARLTDGQKIYVPTMEETRELPVTERTEPKAEGAGGAYRADAEAKKVNLNTADITELMTLSGIGEAKAESILRYREKVGPFQSIEELKNVSGIGDAMFERVREDIVVE